VTKIDPYDTVTGHSLKKMTGDDNGVVGIGIEKKLFYRRISDIGNPIALKSGVQIQILIFFCHVAIL